MPGQYLPAVTVCTLLVDTQHLFNGPTATQHATLLECVISACRQCHAEYGLHPQLALLPGPAPFMTPLRCRAAGGCTHRHSGSSCSSKEEESMHGCWHHHHSQGRNRTIWSLLSAYIWQGVPRASTHDAEHGAPRTPAATGVAAAVAATATSSQPSSSTASAGTTTAMELKTGGTLGQRRSAHHSRGLTCRPFMTTAVFTPSTMGKSSSPARAARPAGSTASPVQRAALIGMRSVTERLLRLPPTGTRAAELPAGVSRHISTTLSSSSSERGGAHVGLVAGHSELKGGCSSRLPLPGISHSFSSGGCSASCAAHMQATLALVPTQQPGELQSNCVGRVDARAAMRRSKSSSSLLLAVSSRRRITGADSSCTLLSTRSGSAVVARAGAGGQVLQPALVNVADLPLEASAACGVRDSTPPPPSHEVDAKALPRLALGRELDLALPHALRLTTLSVRVDEDTSLAGLLQAVTRMPTDAGATVQRLRLGHVCSMARGLPFLLASRRCPQCGGATASSGPEAAAGGGGWPQPSGSPCPVLAPAQPLLPAAAHVMQVPCTTGLQPHQQAPLRQQHAQPAALLYPRLQWEELWMRLAPCWPVLQELHIEPWTIRATMRDSLSAAPMQQASGVITCSAGNSVGGVGSGGCTCCAAGGGSGGVSAWLAGGVIISALVAAGAPQQWPALRVLCLPGSGLGNAGAKALAKHAAPFWPLLQELDLRAAGIRRRGAKSLARHGIPRWPRLTRLALDSNCITDAGARSLVRAAVAALQQSPAAAGDGGSCSSHERNTQRAGRGQLLLSLRWCGLSDDCRAALREAWPLAAGSQQLLL